jgi:Nif-specific regulatory protein
MLAMYFIQKYRHVRVVSGLTPEAQQLLLSYNWPGNVRQLENAIEHALVLGELDYVRPEDLPEALRETKLAEHTQSNSYHSVVSATKRSLVLGALGQVHGNIQEAARILDLSPSYLHRLLRNLDIK